MGVGKKFVLYRITHSHRQKTAGFIFGLQLYIVLSMNVYNKIETLAIVPARGGSKSIPRKNIADLGGKPLMAYCLEAIKSSNSVKRLIVTTDDKEIADVAQQWGAEIPFLRPQELAQDNTPTIPVIEHALLWLEQNQNYKPEYILLIEPTTPFIKPEQIDKTLDLIISKKADSGKTVIAVPRVFHPYHVRHIDSNGYLRFDNPELHYAHPSRQLDPKRYAHGNLWWFKRDLFLKEKKIELGQAVGFEIDTKSAHDINDPFDLEIARSFLIL